MQTKRIRCETLHVHGNFFRSSITQIGTCSPKNISEVEWVIKLHSKLLGFLPKLDPLKPTLTSQRSSKEPPRLHRNKRFSHLQTVLHSCEFPRQHCLDGAPRGKIRWINKILVGHGICKKTVSYPYRFLVQIPDGSIFVGKLQEKRYPPGNCPISPSSWHFWVDDFPFPKVGKVGSLEGHCFQFIIYIQVKNQNLWNATVCFLEANF